MAERLALPTSDHGVAGSNPAGGEILPVPKRRYIAQSLSCSPFHRLEKTEILLKGRPSIIIMNNSLVMKTTNWDTLPLKCNRQALSHRHYMNISVQPTHPQDTVLRTQDKATKIQCKPCINSACWKMFTWSDGKHILTWLSCLQEALRKIYTLIDMWYKQPGPLSHSLSLSLSVTHSKRSNTHTLYTNAYEVITV